MKRSQTSLQRYLEFSSTLHYGMLFTLPLVLIYELGTFILFKDEYYEIRNSGEILIQSFFDWMGIRSPAILSLLLGLLFAGILVHGYGRGKRGSMHANYFIYMFMESMLWGLLLFIAMDLFRQLPLQMMALENRLANMNLALGAGIFEELIFRLIMISALMVVLDRGFRMGRGWALTFSVILSSVTFAAFHLFMEDFYLANFIQRMLGGAVLSCLYLLRGYGISVYSHIVYNMMVLAYTW